MSHSNNPGFQKTTHVNKLGQEKELLVRLTKKLVLTHEGVKSVFSEIANDQAEDVGYRNVNAEASSGSDSSDDELYSNSGETTSGSSEPSLYSSFSFDVNGESDEEEFEQEDNKDTTQANVEKSAAGLLEEAFNTALASTSLQGVKRSMQQFYPSLIGLFKELIDIKHTKILDQAQPSLAAMTELKKLAKLIDYDDKLLPFHLKIKMVREQFLEKASTLRDENNKLLDSIILRNFIEKFDELDYLIRLKKAQLLLTLSEYSGPGFQADENAQAIENLLLDKAQKISNEQTALIKQVSQEMASVSIAPLKEQTMQGISSSPRSRSQAAVKVGFFANHAEKMMFGAIFAATLLLIVGVILIATVPILGQAFGSYSLYQSAAIFSAVGVFGGGIGALFGAAAGAVEDHKKAMKTPGFSLENPANKQQIKKQLKADQRSQRRNAQKNRVDGVDSQPLLAGGGQSDIIQAFSDASQQNQRNAVRRQPVDSGVYLSADSKIDFYSPLADAPQNQVTAYDNKNVQPAVSVDELDRDGLESGQVTVTYNFSDDKPSNGANHANQSAVSENSANQPADSRSVAASRSPRNGGR